MRVLACSRSRAARPSARLLAPLLRQVGLAAPSLGLFPTVEEGLSDSGLQRLPKDAEHATAVSPTTSFVELHVLPGGWMDHHRADGRLADGQSGGDVQNASFVGVALDALGTDAKLDADVASEAASPGIMRREEARVAAAQRPAGAVAATLPTRRWRRRASTSSGVPRAAVLLEAGQESTSEGPQQPVMDGAVEIVRPAQTKSEQIKLEALSEECVFEKPTASCMERFGSYGIRRLFTEDWEGVTELGYLSTRWMSHPQVQERRLFEMTFPGAANAGAYMIDSGNVTGSMYGVVAQSMNVYEQLCLGARYLDVKVGWSPTEQAVWTSNTVIMVPFAKVMQDIKRFLTEFERELVILHVRKDAHAQDTGITYLKEQELNRSAVPGETVHRVVECEMKEMLGTYQNLRKLPAAEPMENPLIGSLTQIGVRLLYFYETQQVLCTGLENCKSTPGWYANSTGGAPFAFGQPMPIGTRSIVEGNATVMEPGCIQQSRGFTKSDHTDALVRNLREYNKLLQQKATEIRPRCFPRDAVIPPLEKPPIFYTLDATIDITPAERKKQQERMRGVKTIFTRGEGFSPKTEAERVNYVLLTWWLRQKNEDEYTRPNAILTEFTAPVVNLRIIEAMQKRVDCNIAVYCKASGSCWAHTLLIKKEDSCVREDEMEMILRNRAERWRWSALWLIFIMVPCCFCCYVACCFGSLWWSNKQLKMATSLAAEMITGEEDMVKCEKCGMPLESKFCSACGAERPSPKEDPDAGEGREGGGFSSSSKGTGMNKGKSKDSEQAPPQATTTEPPVKKGGFFGGRAP